MKSLEFMTRVEGWQEGNPWDRSFKGTDTRKELFRTRGSYVDHLTVDLHSDTRSYQFEVWHQDAPQEQFKLRYADFCTTTHDQEYLDDMVQHGKHRLYKAITGEGWHK